MSFSTLCQTAVTRCRQTCPDLLQYAKTNRDEGIFNDVTLEVDNLSIRANRMVLACHSTFFEKMFKSEMRERYETDIPVTGVNGETADTLVNYMYNGQITIDNDSVMDLLAGADYFQLDDVKMFCFDYLMDRITSNSWYHVLNAAKLYKSHQLQKQVHDFITDHFDEIIQTADFQTFTKSDLASLVSFNLSRSKVNELTIFQAIISWIKHNEDERKKEFPDMFQLIELNRLSFSALQNVSSENLVQENATCAKSVWSLLFKLIKEKEIKEREAKIIMVGGRRHRNKVTEIFNCNNIEPTNYPDLPYSVENHCLLKLNSVVFCIGGSNLVDEADIYNKVYQLNMKETNLRWCEVVSMNEKRCSMGAAVFRDHLVVAGGWNGEVRLTSTECFNHSMDQWRKAPTMQHQRVRSALVVCGESLFVIGGWDGNEYLSSVERLHSLDGEWEFVASMLTRRVAFAAVSLNGLIYALGGRSGTDDHSRQKSVERYDPSLNKWTYVCEMNYARSSASACVLHGRIFVVGGVNVEGNVVNNIECYDPSVDEWKIVEHSRDQNIALYGDAIVL